MSTEAWGFAASDIQTQAKWVTVAGRRMYIRHFPETGVVRVFRIEGDKTGLDEAFAALGKHIDPRGNTTVAVGAWA